jgi:hypothetical protein
LVPFNTFSRTRTALGEVVEHERRRNAHCMRSKLARRKVFVIWKIRRDALTLLYYIFIATFFEAILSRVKWEEIEFLSTAVLWQLKLYFYSCLRWAIAGGFRRPGQVFSACD